MTTTIEWQDRVERLESREEGLRSEFRETLGNMHDVMAANKATGGILSALRVTQLEHSEKLQQHSFLLAGLVEGQKRLEADVSGLKADVSELKQGQARLEGRFDKLERLVRKGFGIRDEE